MLKAFIWICILVLMSASAGHAQGANYTTVKVLNKGWYIAHFHHYLNFEGRPFRSEEQGVAGPSREYVTRVPVSSCPEIKGTNLVAVALYGKQIFNIGIRSADVLCYHVWGTTLFPYWTEMPCW